MSGADGGRVPPADYKSIDEYGAIGNCRTVALVGRDGSIDWCPLPELPSPSVFSAILDRRIGGRFRVGPTTPVLGRQEYLESTNVLRTSFMVEGGTLAVLDFMPLSGSIEGKGGSEAPPQVHRLVRCESGEVEVDVEWSPRFDFARAETCMELTDDGAVATADDERLQLSGLPAGAETRIDEGPTLRARFKVSGGHGVALVSSWGDSEPVATMPALHETSEVWRSWVCKPEATGDRAWAGEWAGRVIRSELALKLLTHAETGAVAAAATTSLPEWIGGPRNWDYRYAWIRDAGETIRAFLAMGHVKEAEEFLEWIEGVSRDCADLDRPHIMYGLRGEAVTDEEELDHFEGYRGSRPVKTGNLAFDQLQLDVFGQLMVCAHEMLEAGHAVSPDVLTFLSELANHACRMWGEPDHGIWEMKETHHFVHSKVMAWVALDRAMHMAEQGHISGDVEEWSKQRAAVREQVLERGWNEQRGAFVQHYDTEALDAANLQLGLQEFLPFDDERMRSTIDMTLEELTTADGMVYRYRTDDGIPSDEGAFILPTFWMVDSLVLAGRLDEALDLFEHASQHANHLGLFSEQTDPMSGALIGNFPQAFSHIGLINSALYLSKAQGRDIPVASLNGAADHRQPLGHL